MHIIDRRLNPGGKSLENRQRFLRRAKAQLRRAVHEASQARDIRGVLQGGQVGIPVDGIEESRFGRGAGGVRDQVLPGNRTYIEGDVLPRREQDGGGGASGAGEGDDTDAFRFLLTREEFLDFFLDDLELPDLAKRRLVGAEHERPHRAGYSVSGSPANIAVNRTMRHALMRRLALGRPRAETIERLDTESADCDDLELRSELETRATALKARARRIPYIDPVDIRYRRYESVPRPVAQAVMFCLMDVSISMSEHMKDLAKRFYMLLYIFLNGRYDRVDIVFIRHTERAEEVDEETFFRSPATGGTLVSSALEEMRRIIAARYRPQDWNIYAAQASDGDNPPSDGAQTERLLREALLPVSQYFAYLEVAEPGTRHDSTLWDLYKRVSADCALLATRKVSHRKEIFPVFRELFQRRVANERVAR